MLLQTFLDHTNFQNGDVDNLQFKPDLLAAIFRNLLQCPNFSTVLCEAVRTMVISEQFITDFCDMLHLSVSEKLGIDLALADSENFEIRTSGTLHVHTFFCGILSPCLFSLIHFSLNNC